jgi:hypothetical protein
MNPLPDKIVVTITPRDVLTTTDFTDIHSCALCKALRRKLKLNDNVFVSAGPSDVDFYGYKSGYKYQIEGGFSGPEFRKLRARAESGERFKVQKTLTRVV